MAQAKKPSIELRDKENINPSLVRKNEAVDSDFHNIYEVLFDHAQKIDGFTGGNTGNKFYGFHSSLEILAGAYPDVEENSFAIIEGVTPQIAQFKNGEWINTGGRAPFIFLDNKFQKPDIGNKATWYIIKDSNTASLWYAGKYHDFVMPDLSNYYTKEEINEDFTKNGGNTTDTGESLRLAINANESDLNDLKLEVSNIEIPEIVDALNSTFADKTLSANMGRVLMGFIDDINVFLNGDDVNLDQIKEIADYIKQNASDLENLSVSNIAGLPSALAGKEDKFSKNTAFNKNFGTGQNDVMPGNFVSAADKTKWNNKETPSGAQAKANTAEQNAKDYADTLGEDALLDEVKASRVFINPLDLPINYTKKDVRTYLNSNGFTIDKGHIAVIDIGEIVSGSGGNNVYEISEGGNNYRVHIFTSSGIFSINDAIIDYIVVAGGGSGGDSKNSTRYGGGGGGGGFISGSNESVSGGTYTVNVGAGGAISPSLENGNDSSFLNKTAIGGGHGGLGENGPRAGADGGSGGGAGSDNSTVYSSGVPGQGHAGGIAGVGFSRTAGGGGGAGSVGGDAGSYGGVGGSGKASTITGASTIYATGGVGGYNDMNSDINANNNTGSGGDGGSSGGYGGSGGSGIVVIRYRI